MTAKETMVKNNSLIVSWIHTLATAILWTYNGIRMLRKIALYTYITKPLT